MGPNTQLVETLNFFYLLAFVVGLFLGAAFTGARLLRYWRNGQRAPELLWRDVIARTTLMLPFGGILVLRFLQLDPFGSWWGSAWYIISGALAVIGVWVYVYYEAFVIER